MRLGDERGDDLEFSMLENSLDSIAWGLRLISSGTNKSDLKHAVLSLSTGVALILKARLEKQDWRLLFPDPEKADARLYQAGAFTSLDFDTCLERLEDYCGISFSPEEKTKLRTFRQRRHRLEHFRMRETKEAIVASAAETLAVLLNFVGNEFDFSLLQPEEKKLLLEIQRTLAEFQAFTEKRLKEIEREVQSIRAGYGDVIECPSCLQHALSADVRVRCLFCGYADEAEKAADFYVTTVMGVNRSTFEDDGEYEEYPLHWCLNCGNHALVDKGITGGQCPAVQFVCFACGFTWSEGELKVCPTCGEPMNPDGFVGDRCSDCDAAYLAQDHT